MGKDFTPGVTVGYYFLGSPGNYGQLFCSYGGGQGSRKNK